MITLHNNLKWWKRMLLEAKEKKSKEDAMINWNPLEEKKISPAFQKNMKVIGLVVGFVAVVVMALYLIKKRK